MCEYSEQEILKSFISMHHANLILQNTILKEYSTDEKNTMES